MNGGGRIDVQPFVQHALAIHRLPGHHGAGEIGHVQHSGLFFLAIDLNLSLNGEVGFAIPSELFFFVIQCAPHFFVPIFFGDGLGIDVKKTLVIRGDALPLGIGIHLKAHQTKPTRKCQSKKFEALHDGVGTAFTDPPEDGCGGEKYIRFCG